MPRGRKNTSNTNEELTQQEVYDLMEFAKNMGYFQGIFTPDLVNQRLKEATLSPLAADEDKINKALLDPLNHEQDLIGYGQFFEMTDMLYKRQLLYLGNLLSWDIDYFCTNATDKDYTSRAYKKDEDVLKSFLDKFSYKAEFTTVVRQLFRQEAFYSILRDEGEKYVLQELPYKYCKVTSRFEQGLLFDINLYYWLLPGVDLRCYPKAIADRYREVFGDQQSSNGDYKPSNNLNHRDGNFAYWSQTTPTENFWMWKLSPEIVTMVPFFAAQFPDLVLRPMIRKLQKNKYVQEAQKILVSIIGLNKDNKSGNVRDALNISPETAGKFVSLMRQGIAQEIAVTTGPWTDVKAFDFEGTGQKKNILDEYTKVAVGSGGNNTRLLYNSSDKSNALETTNSIAIDEALCKYLYSSFSNFIEFYVNRKTSKFKFKIQFSGTNLPADMERKKKDALEFASVGLVDLSSFAAAKGINVFDLERKMQMNKAKKINEMFEPLVSANQMSNKESDGGRPSKSLDQLKDSGSQTRESGSNIMRGGQE